MPTPKIRWTSKQKAELQKEVKRYNDKLRREIKKNPELKDFAPPKVSVTKLKESITTNKELKEQVKSLNNIFKKGYLTPVTTTAGVKTVQGVLDEYEKKVSIINKQREKELKLIPDNPIYYGILGTIEANNLQPKKFNPDAISPKYWNNFLASIDAQLTPNYLAKKRELYKNNYILGIQRAFNSMGDDIVSLIESVSPEIVARAYYTSPYLQLSFVYGKEEEKLLHDLILDEWNKIINNE